MHRDWERVDKFHKTLPSENVTRNFYVKNNERVTLRFHPKTPTLERHYKDFMPNRTRKSNARRALKFFQSTRETMRVQES